MMEHAAQGELIPFPPLAELVAKMRNAYQAPAMATARKSIVAHPECNAVFLAALLTGERPPRLPAEYDDTYDPLPFYGRGCGATDRTWRSEVELLFDAMFDDPKLTFEEALRVWEHPTYQANVGQWPPDSRRLNEPFQDKLSLAEQFDAIEKRIEVKGVEHGSGHNQYFRESLLEKMLRWLTPLNGEAEHLRRWLLLGLSKDFHSPQSDKESFLSVLRLMRRIALAQ